MIFPKLKSPLLLPALLAFTLGPILSAPCRADEAPEDVAHEATPGETTDSPTNNLHELNDKLTQSRAVPYFENGQLLDQ